MLLNPLKEFTKNEASLNLSLFKAKQNPREDWKSVSLNQHFAYDPTKVSNNRDNIYFR